MKKCAPTQVITFETMDICMSHLIWAILYGSYFMESILTATGRAGSRLPSENEHDSSKIVQETPLKFKAEFFGAIKISPKKFFSAEVSPEIFFRPRIDFFGIRNT